MAFSTLPGSDSAATTFQGTEGADSIVILDLPNESTSFEANGEAGDDFVAVQGSQNLSTIRGGQGNDLITQNIVDGPQDFSSFWSAGLISGNQGDDVIGNNQYGVTAIASTINGGQGQDQLFIGSVQSTLLNGNMGDDLLTVDGNFGFVNINGSSIWGGQGDDSIFVDSDYFGFDANVNNTNIGGNLGNDYILVDIDGSFAGSVIEGGDGDDRIRAGDSDTGLPIFGGNGNDAISGGLGSDELFGEEGNDRIFGDDGNDYIVGGNGADTLEGSFGTDTILGGDLNDIIVGGAGGDILSGGTGSNRFRYNSFDTADGWLVNVLSGGGGIYALGVNLDPMSGGIDIITDWDASAGTNIIANNANLFDATTPLESLDGGFGVAAADFTAGQNFAIRGSFNQDLFTFTFSSNGSDVLIGVSEAQPVIPGEDGSVTRAVVLTDVSLTTTFSQANFV
ncbi:calcium-binding protein [Synechococcus sp. CCY9201]|uniref:calcium-binding protein n=1 Tax=Synechococcus sp. CCY9201 TaxID=174697 RepID=UPI002B206855|nr:calcium-binding protein [Synechococcus sp. CCY9201]MEA5472762.1 calcium-binding protein [Synechococcus sp. CCY9201]